MEGDVHYARGQSGHSPYQELENTHALVWIGEDGPQDRALYDPTTDVQDGHLALIRVDEESSTGGRGWEIVRVDGDRYEKNGGMVFDCTVLAPSGTKARGHNGQWIGTWYTSQLLPAVDNNKRVIEEHGLPVDCVMYSMPPAPVRRKRKGYKIPRGAFNVIKEQLKVVKGVGRAPASMPNFTDNDSMDDPEEVGIDVGDEDDDVDRLGGTSFYIA